MAETWFEIGFAIRPPGPSLKEFGVVSGSLRWIGFGIAFGLFPEALIISIGHMLVVNSKAPRNRGD